MEFETNYLGNHIGGVDVPGTDPDLTVVAIPGMGLQLEAFEDLRQEMPEARWLCWNRPGMDSDTDVVYQGPARDLDDFAHEVAHVMREQRVTQAHLVGQSWGGAIALRVAEFYPELVESMLLVEPTVWMHPEWTDGSAPLDIEACWRQLHDLASIADQSIPMAMMVRGPDTWPRYPATEDWRGATGEDWAKVAEHWQVSHEALARILNVDALVKSDYLGHAIQRKAIVFTGDSVLVGDVRLTASVFRSLISGTGEFVMPAAANNPGRAYLTPGFGGGQEPLSIAERHRLIEEMRGSARQLVIPDIPDPGPATQVIPITYPDEQGDGPLLYMNQRLIGRVPNLDASEHASFAALVQRLGGHLGEVVSPRRILRANNPPAAQRRRPEWPTGYGANSARR